MYKKVDGETERFLFVPERWANWAIKESADSTSFSYFIESGRGTNSPASSESGASHRIGLTSWYYVDINGYLKEGDISLSCIQE